MSLLSPFAQASDQIIQLRLNAALDIVQICRIHQKLYENTYMHTFLVHPIFQSLLVLVREEPMNAYRSEIVYLCTLFRSLGRRFPWVIAAFRMFQVTSEQNGQRLPEETDKLFEDFERNDWAEEQWTKAISLYPAHQDARPEVKNMQDFFDGLDRLNLSDTKP